MADTIAIIISGSPLDELNTEMEKVRTLVAKLNEIKPEKYAPKQISRPKKRGFIHRFFASKHVKRSLQVNTAVLEQQNILLSTSFELQSIVIRMGAILNVTN